MLDIPTLDNVRVDQSLFVLYEDELNSFSRSPGNSVTVVPEPTSLAIQPILEIARVVRDAPVDFSIESVGFGLEETGIIGSREYARDAAAQGRQLIGTISLDMIGYRSKLADSQIPILLRADMFIPQNEFEEKAIFRTFLGKRLAPPVAKLKRLGGR